MRSLESTIEIRNDDAGLIEQGVGYGKYYIGPQPMT